jgi:hypothetical protein
MGHCTVTNKNGYYFVFQSLFREKISSQYDDYLIQPITEQVTYKLPLHDPLILNRTSITCPVFELGPKPSPLSQCAINLRLCLINVPHAHLHLFI